MEPILNNILGVLLIILIITVTVNCILDIINGRKLHKSMLEYYNRNFEYLNDLKDQSEKSEDK